MAEINSAQKFFEESIVRSRSAESSVMDMGNMIVDWDNASVEETERFKIVSATFKSQYCLKVERIPEKEDSTKNYRVPAWQRILVYTHKGSGKMKYFFQTLIPERSYFKMYKHPDWNNFKKISSYPDYSGYVIFTDGETHDINLLSFYRDGVLKYRASCSNKNQNYNEHILFINTVLNSMNFYKYTNIISRTNFEVVTGGTSGGGGSSHPTPSDGNETLWDDLDEENTGGNNPPYVPPIPENDNGEPYKAGGNNRLMSSDIRNSTGINCHTQHSLCACISYILYYFNKNVSTSDIIDELNDYPQNLDLIDNLIYPSDVPLALNVYFNTSRLSYITDALYSERFSISVFHPFDDNDFSRAVVIVGENATEAKLIYWDPLYDCLMKRPITDFDIDFSHAINSVK